MIRTTLRMAALGAGTMLAVATLASPPSLAQAPETRRQNHEGHESLEEHEFQIWFS